MVAESLHLERGDAAGVEAGSIACAHCGEPVPPGLVRTGDAHQFCCAGCRGVHAIVTSCGLERYYDLLDAENGRRRAVAVDRGYEEFDEPVFQRLYVRQQPDGTHAIDLFLENVHCAACLWLVERLPRLAHGIIEARLDLRRAIVHLRWQPGTIPLSAVARLLSSLGYPPHPARSVAARAARLRDDRRQLIRLGVAGACAGNVMLLAVAMYAGLFDAIDPAHLRLFRWVSMGLSIVAVAWPGSVFFRSAWAALRTRTLALDVPIALALGIGTGWGVMSTIRGTGEIYFDSLSVLVFALLLGRYFQQRQQRWSADAVELLFSLTPGTATLLERGGLPGAGASDAAEESLRMVRDRAPAPGGEPGRVVPIEAIRPGDLVLVRAGDSIPADGRIERGETTIDRAILTGESMPAPASAGDEVHAGAVNLSRPIEVRVEATGEDTRVGKLLRLVEAAADRRAPIVRLADRIAAHFTIVVLALAILTVAAWWTTGVGVALEHAVALLIVTCPCALGLATPLAVTVAIGRAARAGILIKGGDVIERLARGRTSRGIILLDKTGTITEGRLSVVRMAGDPAALHAAAAVERSIAHPVAAALVAWSDRSLGGPVAPPVAAWLTPDSVEQLPGRGVIATLGGRRIAVGSPAFVRSIAQSTPTLVSMAEHVSGEGFTPVMVAVDDRVEAVAGLGDTVRADARSMIERVRSAGWEVALLSGDHPAVVERVAASLGIPSTLATGGASPEEKVRQVECLSTSRCTVMVGDGVNDAAAMAVASVGVTVHGGAEASLAAADVHLTRPGLAPIAELLDGSRRAIRVIRRNLAVSLAYNTLAAALAMSGLISPLLAAVIMPISSLTVVVLSVRARTFISAPMVQPVAEPGHGPAAPQRSTLA